MLILSLMNTRLVFDYWTIWVLDLFRLRSIHSTQEGQQFAHRMNIMDDAIWNLHVLCRNCLFFKCTDFNTRIAHSHQREMDILNFWTKFRFFPKKLYQTITDQTVLIYLIHYIWELGRLKKIMKSKILPYHAIKLLKITSSGLWCSIHIQLTKLHIPNWRILLVLTYGRMVPRMKCALQFLFLFKFCVFTMALFFFAQLFAASIFLNYCCNAIHLLTFSPSVFKWIVTTKDLIHNPQKLICLG